MFTLTKSQNHRPRVWGTGKILLIIDDPYSSQLLHTTLTRAGHEVWKASDVEEAQQYTGSHAVDVILMDLWWPRPWEVEFLRRGQDQSAAEVIVLIGPPASETRDPAVDLSGFVCIEKPPAPDLLCGWIARMLAFKALRSRLEEGVGAVEEQLGALQQEVEGVRARNRRIMEEAWPTGAGAGALREPELHLLVASNRELIVRGVRQIVAECFHARVEGAKDTGDLFARAEERKWEVLVLDVELSGSRTVEVVRHLHEHDHRPGGLVVLCRGPDARFLSALLAAGIRCGVDEHSSVHVWLEAIEAARQGIFFLSQELEEVLSRGTGSHVYYCA